MKRREEDDVEGEEKTRGSRRSEMREERRLNINKVKGVRDRKRIKEEIQLIYCRVGMLLQY